MPVNPNIALGIQPIQQPNMLAQYGQMMALKAAQQETEGYEGLRGALSQGVPDDPTKLLQYGKQGRATYESLIKGRKEQLDSAEKRLTLTGQIAGYVRDNPTAENFISAVGTMQQNGVLTPQQAQRVIADAGNDPAKIKTYAERAASDALKEADRLSAQTTRRGQDITAGTTIRGQDMTDARMREQQAFERNKRSVIAGEGQFLQTDAYGNVYPVAQYGALRGPNAPAQPLPQAAANAFVTARPSVNALAPTAPPVVQPGSPTVANALAMEQQQNIPRPKVPYTAPVAVMKDGKPVLVQGREAIGMQPASADAEKAARLQAQQVRDLGLAITNLESAVKPGGLISQSTGSGLGRAYDVGAGFFGNAPEGAIAAAKLAPIADMVLKMVPRFEGPQSDKDTQSYKEAAGQLANPNLPTKLRQEAGKEILRLMKERKDQFVSTDMAREGFGAVPSSSARSYSPQEQQALEWANSNANDPRSAQIKQRLGVQ